MVHALGAEAIVDPEIRAAWRDVDDAITDTCGAALHAAGARPQPCDIRRLRTLVDGLTARMLLSDDPETATEARRLLDEALLDATTRGAPSVRAAA